MWPAIHEKQEFLIKILKASKLLTLYGITQCIPNKQKTIDHNSYAIGQ